jgi:hypothetical protein
MTPASRIVQVLLIAFVGAAMAQTTPNEAPMSAILYAPGHSDNRLSSKGSTNGAPGRTDGLSLTAGMPGTPARLPLLSYFNLDGNWLRVQGGRDDRSVIQDLGAHRWTDSFQIPIVPPLTELKPGERRHLIIDDRPYDPDSLAARSTMQGVTSARSHDVNSDDFPSLPPAQPSVRKASVISAEDLEYSARVLARVVADHMYVVHVVNGQLDFYALVHVDKLVSNKRCTVSWKRVSDKPKVNGIAPNHPLHARRGSLLVNSFD